MNRVWYKNPENPIAFFKQVWDMTDIRWIDEIDISKTWTRTKLEMPLDEFLEKLERGRLVQFRFVEEDTYIGGRYFTAFVRFKDPDVERDLFGWVYIPVNKAGELKKELEVVR